MNDLLAPKLSEKDPTESSEGGIDPLGTDPIADALAMKLAPGVRERQQHPRFLTAMAISLSLCSEFDDEVVARDGVSQPWQVFEWFVVHGLVLKRWDNRSDIRGLPGVEKAARAIDERVPLSAKRYLKSPSVVGFHGVYRLLSQTLGIEKNDRLWERGDELLRIWAKEQGLGGFSGTGGGVGAQLRKQLVEALRDSLAKAAVARNNGWEGWNFFSDYLAQFEAGRREATFLWNVLLDDDQGFRREVMQFIASPEGKRRRRGGATERQFHEALARRGSAELRRLLRAINLFEQFSRLAQDAFDDCLHEMTNARGKVSPSKLGRLASVRRASAQIPKLFGKVMENLDPYGETLRFQRNFDLLSEPCPATKWVVRLMDHHAKTQKQKPPAGKLPWVERHHDGSYLVRSLYYRHEPAFGDGQYVHRFRTQSLWSFARDLRRV